ncbi:MAG TPA: argininosuccinate lyase [Bacillota bacterium]|nr:argininosuccinate lyase [Bacillota bacterium]
MGNLWAGRAKRGLDDAAESFNSSISFDSRMFREDIEGSIAHAEMLGKTGIIPADAALAIKDTLAQIKSELESGKLTIDMSCEDIHTFVENELTRRIGDAGKMLHTARSRNDQVATDLRLYLRRECGEIINLIRSLVLAITDKAEEHASTIMPGYTHLQRAQPVTFGFWLSAYAFMLKRDVERITDATKRINVSPLGSCALAGTTYPTDRHMTAELLGFSGVCDNAADAVSDRDFVLELAACLSIIMVHLSRMAEEFILFSSWEYRFIEVSEAYSTGSSIMPQKKNADVAELIRGKTGRVTGDLMALLTVMKGLPLAYDKDMQEDKEAIFDAVDTVKACLSLFAPMISTCRVNKQNMYEAARRGFLNATDLADYLTKKGVPFRDAYRIVGTLVAYCSENGLVLDELPLEIYKKYSEAFDSDLYGEISLETCVSKRTSLGGTAPSSVMRQIKSLRDWLES